MIGLVCVTIPFEGGLLSSDLMTSAKVRSGLVTKFLTEPSKTCDIKSPWRLEIVASKQIYTSIGVSESKRQFNDSSRTINAGVGSRSKLASHCGMK
jgi:hypothetical protein